jgi:hypothetical protein
MRVNGDARPDIFMALCSGWRVFIQKECGVALGGGRGRKRAGPKAPR